jgi:hypothetical protein
MALKLVLDSLDGLGESVSKEYVETDGKFFLQTEAAGGLAVEDVDGLKGALGKERKAAADAAKALKAFEGIKDAKTALAAIKKVEEMADWKPTKETEEKIAAFKKQLVEQHEMALKKATDRGDNMEGQLKGVLVEAAAVEALTKEGGRIGLMLPHVLNRVTMREANGKYIAEVLDESGNPAIGDAQGNPMTIPQLVTSMKGHDDYSAAFDGTGNSGTGSGGGDKPNKPSIQGGVRQIPSSDQDQIDANFEDIASGKAVVVEG